MTAARTALALLCFLALCFGAALFGAAFPPGEWYDSLRKPSWNPPAWLFGPVWTLLYAMMAASGFLSWRARAHPLARPALAAWGAQLLLNALWSWIFFGLRRMDLALAEMSALWIAILISLLLAWRVRPLAGALLAPYLGWVSFAWWLNLALWRLNS
jgi:benzodiazapine receptor